MHYEVIQPHCASNVDETVDTTLIQFGTTSGIMVSMSAFLKRACLQCYSAGSSLGLGMNLRILVYCGIFCGILLLRIFSGYPDFLPSFIS